MGSFNISSVTYTSTGNYSFAFTTALSDANYAATSAGSINAAQTTFTDTYSFSRSTSPYYTAPTTSGFTWSYVNSAGAFDNPYVSNISIFGT